MQDTKCLYLCEVHLAIALKEIEFGNAIDSIKDCYDSKCEYCDIRKAVVRLFVIKNHWLVDKFLQRNTRAMKKKIISVSDYVTKGLKITCQGVKESKN